MTTRALSTPSRSGESGGAFIAALVGLVLLSLMALTLAFISSTEALLGNNERDLERVLYAADAGVGLATAKALVVPDNRPLRLEMPDPGPNPNVSIQNEVEVSPLRPLLVTPCNLCQINQGSEFFRIDHAVTVRVERVAWNGTGPRPASPRAVARKQITAMIDFQPWRQSVEAFAQAVEADASDIEF